jgi:hypothetical protein
MTLRQLWQRITTTRYTRALETEVGRLRAENRALLNSILGIAGVPPLPVVVAPPAPTSRLNAPIAGATIGVDVASPTPQPISKQGASNVAVPMRRRSWQQINRMLEFEAAKKKDANVTS